MALKKKITDELGGITLYHRLENIVFDFNLGQLHLTIKSYADESFREKEKAQLDKILTKINRYLELSAKNELTNNEAMGLRSLDIQELEARKIDDFSLKTFTMTLSIEDGFADKIYKRVAKEIDLFKNSTEV